MSSSRVATAAPGDCDSSLAEGAACVFVCVCGADLSRLEAARAVDRSGTRSGIWRWKWNLKHQGAAGSGLILTFMM